MSSGNESDDEPISTEMLEDIRGGSQYHPNLNRREHATRYVITLKTFKHNVRGFIIYVKHG